MTNPADPTATVRDLPLDPGGEVEIVVPAGSLRIRGVDGERVVIRTSSGRAIDGALAVDASRARIRIHDLERRFRLGPFEVRAPSPGDLEVDVPRSARVVVRTLSGDVEATGIGGESHWATASGDLRLGVGGGPVVAESMSGDVVLVAAAAIDLTARSVSGDLQLRGPSFEGVAASTTSGDVHLDAALSATGVHRISSVSGDVELVTPSPVTVETETITGDVRASGRHTAAGGRGRRTMSFGDGMVRVTIRTTSGDIRLASRPGAETPGASSADAGPDARSNARGAASGSGVGRDTPATTAGAPDLSAVPEPPTMVAEAEAAPNLMRGGTGDTRHRDAARLEVLRALERGELDVEAASRRLESVEQGGAADG
jgi:Toastrack DUF4097